MGNTQQDFESYQARKYQAWKNKNSISTLEELDPENRGQRTDEQRSFEEYLKTIDGTPPDITDTRNTNENPQWYMDNHPKQVLYEFKLNSVVELPKKGPYSYSVVQTIIQWDNQSGGLPLQIAFQGMDKTDTMIRYAEDVTTWGKWKPIDDKSYSYSKAEIDKIISGLTPGGGGGGGSREPVIVPEDSPTIKEYEGAYGVNVINYRELSRDPRFIVNKNIITTKGQRIAHGDKGQLQDGLLLNRIRKTTWGSTTDVDKAEITFKYKILKSDSDRQTESDGLEVLFMRIPEEGEPQASDKILLQGQLNNTHSTTHDFKDSGYFKIDVGGANNKKVSGSVQLSAHYGDIDPIEHNVYDQSFIFKKVNGIELLANSNNAHDVYQVNPLAHRVKKVLNRVKIKDLQFIKAHDFNNSMAGLLLKIPDDCRLYNDNNGAGYGTVEEAKKSINNNLMTNNLCDLSVDEDTGEVYDRPYFIKTIVTEHIGSETYDCFFIAIDKNHADKWQEHLSETEIVYEIKSSLQSYKQIQAGGILYSLANGDSVCTHNYGEVVAGCPWFKPQGAKYDKYMITFQNSPFGFQDRTILVDEIVGMRKI